MSVTERRRVAGPQNCNVNKHQNSIVNVSIVNVALYIALFPIMLIFELCYIIMVMKTIYI